MQLDILTMFFVKMSTPIVEQTEGRLNVIELSVYQIIMYYYWLLINNQPINHQSRDPDRHVQFYLIMFL